MKFLCSINAVVWLTSGHWLLVVQDFTILLSGKRVLFRTQSRPQALLSSCSNQAY